MNITKGKILVLLLVLLLAYAVYAVTKKKPHPVGVNHLVTPRESIYNDANLKLIPKEKRDKVYQWHLRFEDVIGLDFKVAFNVEKYKQAHPNDLVLIEYDERLGRIVEIFVSSDKVDGNFFTEDESGALFVYL